MQSTIEPSAPPPDLIYQFTAEVIDAQRRAMRIVLKLIEDESTLTIPDTATGTDTPPSPAAAAAVRQFQAITQRTRLRLRGALTILNMRLPKAAAASPPFPDRADTSETDKNRKVLGDARHPISSSTTAPPLPSSVLSVVKSPPALPTLPPKTLPSSPSGSAALTSPSRRASPSASAPGTSTQRPPASSLPSRSHKTRSCRPKARAVDVHPCPRSSQQQAQKTAPQTRLRGTAVKSTPRTPASR